MGRVYKRYDTENIMEVDDPRLLALDGYLDAKMQPVETVDDLNNNELFPRAQRFIGLTVTVLNKDEDGVPHPVDYWLKEKVTEWVIKNPNETYTEALKSEIISEVSQHVIISGNDVYIEPTVEEGNEPQA